MSDRVDRPGERGETDNPIYQQIIRTWDIARDRGDFPHLASDVHWAFGRARLTCFRSPDEWLTVFQLLTYAPGWGDFNTLVYAYGNGLGHQGVQDATANLRRQAAQQRGRLFYAVMRTLGLQLPPSEREGRFQEELARYRLRVPPLVATGAGGQLPLDDDWWCRDPFHVRIMAHGRLLDLHLTQQDYDEAGVDLHAQISGDGVLDRIIHVMRVLCHRLPPEDLFYPPHVLLQYAARPPDLPMFLELEEWCNPGLGAVDKPSDSACLRSLAGALASSRPEAYSCPEELVNTHWSGWPGWLGEAVHPAGASYSTRAYHQGEERSAGGVEPAIVRAAMTELTPENVGAFLKRFQFEDGLIVSIHRWYTRSLDPDERARVVAQVIDNEQYGKWVHLVFDFDDVKQMLIIEGNYALTVIDFPFRMGFFDELIYIDLAPQYEEPHSPADFQRSKLMVAARSCSWSIEPIPGYD